MEYFNTHYYVDNNDKNITIVPMCPKELNIAWDKCMVCEYHKIDDLGPNEECINCKWFDTHSVGEDIPGALGGMQVVANKYNLHDRLDVSAEHDILYMGPPEYVEGKRLDTKLSNYTLEERQLMTTYGWSWSWEFECWSMNT